VPAVIAVRIVDSQDYHVRRPGPDLMVTARAPIRLDGAVPRYRTDFILVAIRACFHPTRYRWRPGPWPPF
jgi:hypothetical protein